MAKKTKITAASIARAMQLVDVNLVTITCGVEDDIIEIPVKSYLPIDERAALVNDVISMIFIADENGTKYCPAFRKFAIEYNVVDYFTEVSLPLDSNKANKFLEQSGIFDKIVQVLQEEYIVGILDDINESIEYRKQELLKGDSFGSVIGKILGVAQMLNDKVKEIDFSQIMEFVEENLPEFKDQLKQLIAAEVTETVT